MKKRILYIGPAPQNIGGVSIHLRRLLALLKDDIICDFVDEGHVRYEGYFNLRSKRLFTYLGKVRRADVVHIHSGTWLLRVFHVIVAKLLLHKKTIVTIHRDPRREPHLGLTRRVMRLCDHVIMVNREGLEALSCDCCCKYHLMPAFLPPVVDDEPELQRDILDFIAKARMVEESVVLCSNAGHLVLNQGEDLYGLDICIEAISILPDNFFLIFVVAANPDNQDLMRRYKERITSCNLEDRILIWESPASFVRLVCAADIVLRTTNTDGDAITVREGIYLNRQVIASDVVDRPEGTLLFKNRDVSDLANMIKSTPLFPHDPKSLPYTDYKTIYLNFYNAVDHRKVGV